MGKIAAMLSNGGAVGGVRILSEAGVRSMLAEPKAALDGALLLRTPVGSKIVALRIPKMFSPQNAQENGMK